VHALDRPTPFALPLMVERFRERLSTESLGDRLLRMVQALEVAADATMGTALAQGPATPVMLEPADTPGPARPRRARGQRAAR
jgi:ATP-dependent Lhr-like helicase